ncbi:MAG: efflux RND transporter periplasmic adaptor subunit [Acidobacteria bacterium]|nr:efflux RND transporter periplasmic adaptor subunit [Acidobacteriota bacterium]MBV9070628.1 efflux RND transporter periplasmic adaptor subunit [Acidobacteriota bacterium]MBV9478185.1 efflux RND transporter periplasmic adaptor subunit [Acidobacteriota bacterium]
MSAKRKRKITIVSVILLIVVIGGAVAIKASTKDKKAPESPVKTGKAEVADIQVKVTEVGTVEPEVKVDVKSALSGKVVEILHRDGDVVRRGDVLARVEPDLNQAQSLAETKSSLTATEIRFNEAKKNYEADNQLFLQGLLAPKAHRDTETAYFEAREEYDKARQKYAIVEKSGIPISQSAENFQGSNVVAPMDGVVLTKNVEIGESITSGVSSFNAGTVLFTVADTSRMIVKAGVNEVDIGKIHVAMPVKVTLDAYPKVVFKGKIDRIAPAVRIDDKVRVFDVEIRLDAQGRELRSGMTANIEVIGERKDKVLSVPVESVFKRDEQEIVYVKKAVDPKALAAEPKKLEGEAKKQAEKDAWKKFFEKRPVVTGLADNGRVEILSGVKPGDEIAIEDPTVTKDKNDDNDD